MNNGKEAPALVTGPYSLIGRELVPSLAARGVPATLLGRSRKPTMAPGMTFIAADLADGWPSSLKTAPPVLYHTAYLPLLIPLLEEGAAAGLERIVAFSSTSRFVKEDSSQPEERQVAEELAQAEEAAHAFCAGNGVALTILRPTLIVSPPFDSNVSTIIRFIKRYRIFPLAGEGRGLRQPVFAHDLARAALQASSSQATFGRSYNISGGETLTYRAMVERIFDDCRMPRRILPLPLPILKAGIRALSFLPRYRYLTPAMAERMNRDLVFSHDDAVRDFGYAPATRFSVKGDDLSA